MRTLVLLIMIGVAISTSGCALFQSGGDLDRASVEKVEKNFGKISEKFVLYVDADERLTDGEKEDEKAFVEATQHLITSMKNRIGKEED